jgi:hypothetical protein
MICRNVSGFKINTSKENKTKKLLVQKKRNATGWCNILPKRKHPNVRKMGKYVSKQQDLVRNERCCMADDNGENDRNPGNKGRGTLLCASGVLKRIEEGTVEHIWK